MSLWWVGLVRIPLRRLIVIVVIALGVPFILRQIQVAAAMGGDFWYHDFLYTFGRRVPLASLFFTVPDSLTLSRWYEAHNAIKWPGGGGPMMALTWAFVFVRAHVATLGVPSLLLGGLGLYAGWLRHRVTGPVNAGLSLLVALGIALTVTLVVFGEYVSVFYGIFLMPLAVHWIILLLGLTTYVLVAHRRAMWRSVPVGAALLAAFILWRVGTEVRNIVVLPPVGYPGREALAELKGHSVATLWISSAPSAYTDQWAAVLQTMRFLVRSPHRFTFDPEEDYYIFFEVDRKNPRYRQPEFLLIPMLRAPGITAVCQPLHGWIWAFADGCEDIRIPATWLSDIPLYRRGENYLLYDLRRVKRD